MSLLDQAKAHVVQDELAKTKNETTNQLRVGATIDDGVVTGGVAFERNWKNGWGAVAYAKAWFNNSPVIPEKKIRAEAGFEVTKKFGDS